MPLILLVACAHKNVAPRSDSVAPTPPSYPDHEVPQGLSLPPSVRVIGSPGWWLGQASDLGLLPAFGPDPSVLILFSYAYERTDPALPASFLVDGHIAPGEHHVLELWDGVSGVDGDAGGVVAGDVDDDGHLDFWYGTELWLGPLLGSEHRWGSDEAVARIVSGGRGIGAAGFDVDGDGNEDALELSSCCQTAWLHYGPFAGEIQGGQSTTPDPDLTWFGDQSGCFESIGLSVLPDHLGPGHHAVAVGQAWSPCGVDTSVYDLTQPRGTRLGPADAFAYADDVGTVAREFHGTGDLDGDGWGEVVYGSWLRDTALLAAPISGFVTGEAPGPERYELVGGELVGALGDLDGDGIAELFGLWIRDTAPFDASWVVVFSPYEDPVDLSQGLEIGLKDALGNDFGRFHADLDGDGLEDVVSNFTFEDWMEPPPPEDLVEAGEIRIWYGKDLLAAEQFRQLGTRRNP